MTHSGQGEGGSCVGEVAKKDLSGKLKGEQRSLQNEGEPWKEHPGQREL